MATLTAIGLGFDLVGAVLLLGPELDVVGKAVKRLDPVHLMVMSGFETLRDRASDVEEGEYSNEVAASDWKLRPLRWFLNRRLASRIGSEDVFRLNGGWFQVNGDRTKLPSEREISTSDKSLHTQTLSVFGVKLLIIEAQELRMYLYGVGLLALGFGLQIVSQFI